MNTSIIQTGRTTKQYSVTRTYKEFHLLHSKLVQTFTSSCIIVPTLPSKSNCKTVLTKKGVGKGGKKGRELEGLILFLFGQILEKVVLSSNTTEEYAFQIFSTGGQDNRSITVQD